MAKRTSSEFNFAPQLKKHIGEPDVEYIFNRKSIYDKTMDLLFRGANSKPRNPSRMRHSLNNSINCISSNTITKDNMKQTIMNNNCQLETKTLVDRSTEINVTQTDKCSFCEKLGCFTTLLPCSRCEELYCNNCSFPVSNENETLCLSCFN